MATKVKEKAEVEEKTAPPPDEFRGQIDPASMVISPQEKITDDPTQAQPKSGGEGVGVAPLSSETALTGTETPYRKTPPTNIGTAAEAAATTTPPTAANAGGADLVNCNDGATPVAAVAPTVAGTTTNGQTLTCTPAPSPWVPAASSYQYLWYRGDIPISGATAATRVLAAADVGYRMSCRVTGIHATLGGSSPAFSAQTAVVS